MALTGRGGSTPLRRIEEAAGDQPLLCVPSFAGVASRQRRCCSHRRAGCHQRAARWPTVGGPAARFGSSSAPQIAQPAAKALTRSPQRGQTCGPIGLMAGMEARIHEEEMKAAHLFASGGHCEMRPRMRQSPEHLSWATLSALVTHGAACRYCGSRDDLVAHHKIPRRRYSGLDQLSNLEPVCRSCHPGVEQDAAAQAELVWAKPDWPDSRRPNRRRPRLLRPY